MNIAVQQFKEFFGHILIEYYGVIQFKPLSTIGLQKGASPPIDRTLSGKKYLDTRSAALLHVIGKNALTT